MFHSQENKRKKKKISLENKITTTHFKVRAKKQVDFFNTMDLFFVFLKNLLSMRFRLYAIFITVIASKKDVYYDDLFLSM